MAKNAIVVVTKQIEQAIFLIRGQKVMLSSHLAELYGTEARILVQAVKRNIERFPEDFMFQLTPEEHENLKSQIVISSWGGARRARPMPLPSRVWPCYPVCPCLRESVAKMRKIGFEVKEKPAGYGKEAKTEKR